MMRLWGLTPPQWRALPEGDRDEMLEEFEQVCPSCGNLRSVCSDPELPWYPQEYVCHATRAREIAVRMLQDRHKKAKLGPGPHPLDGVSVYVSLDDLSPDDEFA